MTPRKTFLAAARDFIASKGSAGTREGYDQNLRRWVAHCDVTGIKVETPTAASAIAFRDQLLSKLRPASVRQILASLSGIYGKVSLSVDGKKPAATWNPFAPKILPWPSAADYAKTEPVPADLARRILALADADGTVSGRRDAAILHLLSATGLRRMSVARIRRADLRRRGAEYAVAVVVKGGDEVEVTIPAAASAALDRWIAVADAQASPKARRLPSEYVFPGKSAGRPICVDLVNKIVRARAKAAGGPGSDAVHPHSFRAAFVTEALDAEVPLNDVRASVHHRSADTTLRYDGRQRGAGVTAQVEARRNAQK